MSRDYHWVGAAAAAPAGRFRTTPRAPGDDASWQGFHRLGPDRHRGARPDPAPDARRRPPCRAADPSRRRRSRRGRRRDRQRLPPARPRRMDPRAGENGPQRSPTGDTLGDTRDVLHGSVWSWYFPPDGCHLWKRTERDRAGRLRTCGITLPRWGSRVRIPSSAPDQRGAGPPNHTDDTRRWCVNGRSRARLTHAPNSSVSRPEREAQKPLVPSASLVRMVMVAAAVRALLTGHHRE